MSDGYKTPYLSEAAVSLDLQRHKLQEELDRMREKLQEAKRLFNQAEIYDLNHPAKSISNHQHRVIRYRNSVLKALEALK